LAIIFHTIETSFSLKGKRQISKWIKREIESNSRTVGAINIILCSDEYLLEINKKHLTHDFYTDIITFNYNSESLISGDLYISVNRVFENASKFDDNFYTELRRVIIHGILHLLGNEDNSPELKERIHAMEDLALKRFPV